MHRHLGVIFSVVATHQSNVTPRHGPPLTKLRQSLYTWLEVWVFSRLQQIFVTRLSCHFSRGIHRKGLHQWFSVIYAYLERDSCIGLLVVTIACWVILYKFLSSFSLSSFSYSLSCCHCVICTQCFTCKYSLPGSSPAYYREKCSSVSVTEGEAPWPIPLVPPQITEIQITSVVVGHCHTSFLICILLKSIKNYKYTY